MVVRENTSLWRDACNNSQDHKDDLGTAASDTYPLEGSRGGVRALLDWLFGGGKVGGPDDGVALADADNQDALLSLDEGGTGGGVDLFVGSGEGEGDGAGVLNLKAILEAFVVGDLLDSEAGVGVVNFDQPHWAAALVADGSLDVGGPAAGDAEADAEGCGGGKQWDGPSNHRAVSRRGWFTG